MRRLRSNQRQVTGFPAALPAPGLDLMPAETRQLARESKEARQ
jgi:hypothetical protein